MPSIRNGLAERSPDDAKKINKKLRKKPDPLKNPTLKMLIARGVALSQLLYLMHCKLGWPSL